ncbi:MAG: ATP-binding protein [Desulfobacterales bacterium]|nr:ATP-binding protein [Desulfobacterales bacterium]
MLEIKTLDDISTLSEKYEMECKLAAGKDGKGELPKDFWPTYSAFANSYGGDIILGLKETANGRGRGTVYHLPGQEFPSADQIFFESSVIPLADDGTKGISLGHNGESLGHNERDETGCLIIKELGRPLIDDLDELSEDIEDRLMTLAQKARDKKRLNKKDMADIVLSVCSAYYLTQQVLCRLVNRESATFRKSTIKPLLDTGKLSLAFPQTPTHPKQAYTTVNSTQKENRRRR